MDERYFLAVVSTPLNENDIVSIIARFSGTEWEAIYKTAETLQ